MFLSTDCERAGGAWPYELSLELVAAQYGPLSYKTDRQLAGTVEADDLYHTAGNKDKRKAVARRRWGAARVAGERNASPVVPL